MVLVHGLGSSSAIWRPVLPALEDFADTLLVDLPGHGDEPYRGGPLGARELADHVGQAMDRRGWDQAHLVGHSLGGWTALEVAADGRARSVTAIAPAGLWHDVHRPPNPLLTLNRAAAVWLRPVTPHLLRIAPLRTFVLRTGSERPGAVSYEDALEAARGMSRSPGYWAALEGSRRTRFSRAADVTVPVTTVWGDRDRILPARRAQAREYLPPQATWYVLDRCGHTPQWDAPDQVVELTRLTVAQAERRRAISRPV